jgi:hypothetical protein
VIKKGGQKILKCKDQYTDPIIDNEGMWNVKTKLIPVIMGATGTV